MTSNFRLRAMLRAVARNLEDAAHEFREYANALADEEVPDPPSPLERQIDLDQDIEVLELSVRSDNCLRAVGVNTIGKLIEMTPETFFHIRSFGARSRDEVNEVLVSLGYEPKVRD